MDLQSDGSLFQLPVLCIVVLVDDRPRPAVTRVFLALGEVKIPRTKNVRTDAHMAKVGVITLERPPTRQGGLFADIDPGVAFARQTITQFEFEIPKMLVLPGEIGRAVDGSMPGNHSIANRPVRRTLFRHGVPAVERFAVEDADEAVAVGGDHHVGQAPAGEQLLPLGLRRPQNHVDAGLRRVPRRGHRRIPSHGRG